MLLNSFSSQRKKSDLSERNIKSNNQANQRNSIQNNKNFLLVKQMREIKKMKKSKFNRKTSYMRRTSIEDQMAIRPIQLKKNVQQEYGKGISPQNKKEEIKIYSSENSPLGSPSPIDIKNTSGFSKFKQSEELEKKIHDNTFDNLNNQLETGLLSPRNEEKSRMIEMQKSQDRKSIKFFDKNQSLAVRTQENNNMVELKNR